MKNITLAILMVLSSFSIASAELGLKVGASVQVGSLETSGKSLNRTTSELQKSNTREALFGTAGTFIEKDLAFLPIPILNRISIGYDTIAHDLDLGTVSNSRQSTLGDKAGAGTSVDKAHKLNAKVDGFSTVYATLNITDWLYIKGGDVSVDIKSDYNGTLKTVSTYATNHTLDGTVVGAGIHIEKDNGLFFRVEYNDYDIDGKVIKSTNADSAFTHTLNAVTGSTGRLSVGKAF